MSEDEEWLNVDADAEKATPSATAALLESICEALRNAPKDYRYDLRLEIDERYPDTGSDRNE